MDAERVQLINLAFKGDNTMTYLTKYTSSDIPELLMERIVKNSIGIDQHFERLAKIQETVSNYPPYNHIENSDKSHRLEVALAGFKRKEISVYTQEGRLYIEAHKEQKESNVKYHHHGLALRSFTKFWSLPDDMKIKTVQFEDGLLTVDVEKVIPETHKRIDYL